MHGSQFLGHPLVVNFWAAWCATCYEEQPGINAAAANYGSRGLQFLGVDMKDSLSDAKSYQKQFNVGYPSISDPANSIGLTYGINSPPSWLFIDSRGVVVRRVEGGLHEADLRKTIDELLAAR